jgi:hypothetical protein
VSLDLDLVDARDLVTRMEQSVGQLSVVGEEEQSLRIVVEPTHGKDARPSRREQIDDDGAALRIGPARDVAARLVKEDVRARLGAFERPAIEGDPVDVGIGLGARLAAHVAVDGDATGGQDRFSAPA